MKHAYSRVTDQRPPLARSANSIPSYRSEMLIEKIRKFFEYNYWANDRLFDKAGAIANEEFLSKNRFPHGSLKETFVHQLFAEWIWRNRCAGQSPKPGDKMPVATDFKDLDSLRTFWAQEEKDMQTFLS